MIERFDPKTGKRGLHNWKHLFAKPTVQDIIIFVLLILTLVNALSYSRDINACRDFYEENSCLICSNSFENSTRSVQTIPINNTFKEENQSINGSVT